MDGNKIVTFEMFKKYHELLMGYIKNGDTISDFDDILNEVLEEESIEDEE